MIRPVSCPSCDTRYGLTPARVRPGHRRARCFRCDTVFGIESEVLVLTAAAAPAPPVQAEPVLAEPVLAEPVQAEPVQAEPIQAEAVQPEPITVEPAAFEAIPVEPDTLDPLAFEAIPIEPLELEPLEPVAAEPQAIEPLPVEPLEIEPLALEPPPEAPMGIDLPPATVPQPHPDLAPVFEEFDAETLALPPAPPRPEPALELPPLEPLLSEGDLDLPSLEELEAATAALEPPVVPPAREGALGVLSESDLLGAEDEIMEKTLVDLEVPPPAADPLAALDPQGDPTTTQGGYSSAKDAIDKLLGGTPPPAASYRPVTHRSGTTMDVEATLSALENTLGGVHAPAPPPVPAHEPVPPVAATLQLTREEMDAAMAALAPPPPTPTPMEATVALPRPPAEATVVLKLPVSEPPPAMDPNLLKVQMGTDLYSNLTMDQLITLAEQGRLAEYHMVARQFSDNWLEASKVPTLRPVFERLRKARAPEAPGPLDTAPVKKSLFGGLFGKG